MKASTVNANTAVSSIARSRRSSITKTIPARLAAIIPQAHPTVTAPSGKKIEMLKTLTVGSSDTCSIQVPQSGGTVAAMHAEVFSRGPRVYCRGLVGDQEDLKARSYTWLFHTELRPGVDYMLSPGSELSFGSHGENKVVVDFSQDSNDAGGMAQLMMGAMAQGASQEVRERFSK